MNQPIFFQKHSTFIILSQSSKITIEAKGVGSYQTFVIAKHEWQLNSAIELTAYTDLLLEKGYTEIIQAKFAEEVSTSINKFDKNILSYLLSISN